MLGAEPPICPGTPRGALVLERKKLGHREAQVAVKIQFQSRQNQMSVFFQFLKGALHSPASDISSLSLEPTTLHLPEFILQVAAPPQESLLWNPHLGELRPSPPSNIHPGRDTLHFLHALIHSFSPPVLREQLVEVKP